MKQVVFVQNMASPYRCHFFNTLCSKDDRYVIYYMSKMEKDRNWDWDKLDKRHNYWLDRFGLYFMLGRFHIHINPILILKILFNRNISDVILGVSYNDLNIMTLALLKKLHLTSKNYYFWAEANYLTIGARNENGFKKTLRKFVFSSVDKAMIVPGKMAVMSFEKWGIDVGRFIFLPNTIDEKNLAYLSNKRHNEIPTFIMPVRLIENIKGVINFFDSIGEENIKKAKFLIAGSGPDYDVYTKYIKDHKYEKNIELLGFCDSSKMSNLYNTADALILPSFSDPSPLSLVEALYYHLPILCSNHCGNNFEAVEEGVNGYTFSPLDSSAIKLSFDKLIFRRSDWPSMGENSYNLYTTRFETTGVTGRFISQLVKTDSNE